jgi:hypothetical protein
MQDNMPSNYIKKIGAHLYDEMQGPCKPCWNRSTEWELQIHRSGACKGVYFVPNRRNM